MDNKGITLSVELSPAEPLWKVAPTRDENGGPVSDILMIIPKLKLKPQHYIKQTLSDIEQALKQFSNIIIFANMDMKLNTLWVSFKAQPGVLAQIIAAIRLRVPEAVIVGDMSSRLVNK